MHITWTDNHDKEIKKGLKEGLSASEIADKLNQTFGTSLTRNSVLGRIFRQSLKFPIKAKIGRPRKQVLVPGRVGRKTRAVVDFRKHADRIMDMRDNGFTWEQIGKVLGCGGPYARLKSIEMGLCVANAKKNFTPEEVKHLTKAWKDHVPVEDIADALGRSYGVIRQKIIQLKLEKRIGTRDPQKTRLLRQYGEYALIEGKTPSEVLKILAQAKADAMVAARHAARAAKTQKYTQAIEVMEKNIKNGMDRNEAIFLARADGVPLQMLGDRFDLTRERIRQISYLYAHKLALQELLEIRRK